MRIHTSGGDVITEAVKSVPLVKSGETSSETLDGLCNVKHITSSHVIENNTRTQGDMKFLVECLTLVDHRREIPHLIT